VTIGFVCLQVISNTHDWGVDLYTAVSPRCLLSRMPCCFALRYLFCPVGPKLAAMATHAAAAAFVLHLLLATTCMQCSAQSSATTSAASTAAPALATELLALLNTTFAPGPNSEILQKGELQSKESM
jgi:hypothetical protein